MDITALVFFTGLVILMLTVATLNKVTKTEVVDCPALSTQGHYRCTHGGIHQ